MDRRIMLVCLDEEKNGRDFQQGKLNVLKEKLAG